VIVLAGLAAMALPAPVAHGGDGPREPLPLAQDHALAHAALKFLRWFEPDATERGLLRRAEPTDLVAALDRLPVRPPITAGVQQMGVLVRGVTWRASIRLPERYDRQRRHPLLVLPDGDAEDADAAFARFAGDPAFADVILLRPGIDALRDDRVRFPIPGLASALTSVEVLHQTLAVARLSYAVDPERVVMFGRGRAASLVWLYGVTFPDDLAAVVPDTAPADAVRDACRPMLRNLAGVTVRSLHARAAASSLVDARGMLEAARAAGVDAALEPYGPDDAASRLGAPPHPDAARRRVVGEAIAGARRRIPTSFTRVMRFRLQGDEGRFRVPPPATPAEGFTVTCGHDGGVVTCDRRGVVYLAGLDDLPTPKQPTPDGTEARSARPDVACGRARRAPHLRPLVLLSTRTPNGRPAVSSRPSRSTLTPHATAAAAVARTDLAARVGASPRYAAVYEAVW
jgi:hypothetical protein